MGGLAAIVLDAAAGLAVPFIKKILADRLGEKGGELAGTVLETITEKLGVPIDKASKEELQEAIVETEPKAAELVLAYVEAQKLTNELQLAEMSKEQTWTWAWRPAWMWFLMAIWGLLFLTPFLNAFITNDVESIDATLLVTLTSAYLALYMGGHTAKEIFAKR